MDLVHAIASWLHVAAAVLALGYYAALALFVVPAMRRELDGPRSGALLLAAERRAAPWLVAALVAFLATGVVLMLGSTRYTGLGQLFASSWAVLVVVKHAVVAAMVVLAAVVDLLVIPDAALPETESSRAVAIGRTGRLTGVVTALGAVVLLLTALAQGS